MTDTDQRFDPDLLGEDEPFEIDEQAAHLFKHPHLGVDDIYDVWGNDPVFYAAKPPAHWTMCTEVGGRFWWWSRWAARDRDRADADRSAAKRPASSWQTRYRRDR